MRKLDSIEVIAEYIVANKENVEMVHELLDILQEVFNKSIKNAYDQGKQDAFAVIMEQKKKDYWEEMRKPPRL